MFKVSHRIQKEDIIKKNFKMEVTVKVIVINAIPIGVQISKS